MHDLYKLKDSLIKELETLGKSGDVSKASLATIDTLAHAAKNLTKVIETCEEDEYSGRGSYGGSYSRSYAEESSMAMDGRNDYVRPDGSYRTEMSNASYARGGRSRDNMGRYSGTDMKSEIRKLMDKAPDARTREELEKLMSRI